MLSALTASLFSPWKASDLNERNPRANLGFPWTATSAYSIFSLLCFRVICLLCLSNENDLVGFFSVWSKCSFSPWERSAVLYNTTELFCFIGSHLAKPHKHPLMQFLPAFYSNHLVFADCDAPHHISVWLWKNGRASLHKQHKMKTRTLWQLFWPHAPSKSH